MCYYTFYDGVFTKRPGTYCLSENTPEMYFCYVNEGLSHSPNVHYGVTSVDSKYITFLPVSEVPKEFLVNMLLFGVY